ncbi:MAG: hypothetical protein [Caudoviricetes sp.]|nr:MAG: hypothetical protein [Caudoviricetes sp.]
MSEALEITRNVSTETTPGEDDLIEQILDRAEYLGLIADNRERFERLKDLKITNANGCPLDFKRWLEADDFDFSEDFFGIFAAIDHWSGKLLPFFWPRFAKKQEGENE